MSSMLRRASLVAAAFALLVCVAPSPAQAGNETLRRSLQNIVFAPLDLALSPWIAGRSVWNGWRESDDTTAVKVVYPVPGYFWQTGVQAGASVLRAVAGSLELVPGVILVLFEPDLDPIYDLAENQEAMVDLDLSGLQVRFGVDYVTPGF